MGLGPPFGDEESGVRLQLAAGAATVIGLLSAVAIALLASDRSLGESFPLRVLVRHPGALHTGAQVKLAGHPIGEVVAIRGPQRVASPPVAPGQRMDLRLVADLEEGGLDQPRVEIHLRLLTRYRRHVYSNSTFFASAPNILTEAVMEVGPPLLDQDPGPPVEPNQTVRGVDPPDVGRLVKKVHQSVTAILQVARDLSPEWEEFRGGFSGLSNTWEQVSERGQVGQIVQNGQRTWTGLASLSKKLGEASLIPRTKALYAQGNEISSRLSPELSGLSSKVQTLSENFDGILAALGPAQRDKLSVAADRFVHVIRLAEQLDGDIRAMKAVFDRGGGTLGGFAQDVQIFDEIQEVHRIIKRETPRLLIKTKEKSQRNLR